MNNYKSVLIKCASYVCFLVPMLCSRSVKLRSARCSRLLCISRRTLVPATAEEDDDEDDAADDDELPPFAAAFTPLNFALSALSLR